MLKRKLCPHVDKVTPYKVYNLVIKVIPELKNSKFLLKTFLSIDALPECDDVQIDEITGSLTFAL